MAFLTAAMSSVSGRTFQPGGVETAGSSTMGRRRSGTVTAISTPLHVGGTTIVVETDVIDASGKRVAKTTQTQTVLRPKG